MNISDSSIELGQIPKSSFDNIFQTASSGWSLVPCCQEVCHELADCRLPAVSKYATKNISVQMANVSLSRHGAQVK